MTAGCYPINHQRLTNRGWVMHIWLGKLGHLLAHIMACRLFVVTLLSKQMTPNCWLDYRQNISVKIESNYNKWHTKRLIWNVFCKIAGRIYWASFGNLVKLNIYSLIHVTHMWVCKLNHWFRRWPGTCLAPNHYSNQTNLVRIGPLGTQVSE